MWHDTFEVAHLAVLLWGIFWSKILSAQSSPRCNMKELMPMLSEKYPKGRIPVHFTLGCTLTQNKQNLLWVSESVPVPEHPTVPVWVRSTGPCPGGLEHLFCLLQDVNVNAPVTLLNLHLFPKAASTGTHQDVSHFCQMGYRWCIAHPTFCPGDAGRSSPGHIPCISLLIFLENMLIFSYTGLDLWPLLPTIFASINSELYSKKAPGEEQLPATIRQ